MIAEGTLDSALWRQIEPFYNFPVSVPQGQLGLLYSLPLALPPGLPVTQRGLARYEPWTPDNIEQFFRDWPELDALRPILVFAATPHRHWGTVGMRTRWNLDGDSGALSGSFHLSPRREVKAEGIVDFGSEWARWNRRRASVSVPVAGEFEVGNYALEIGDGLVTGAFGGDTGREVLDNWLYAAARSWNGVLWGKEWAERVSALAFVHARPWERGAGTAARVAWGRRAETYAGITAFATAGGADTAIHVSAGTTLSPGAWTIELHTAVEPAAPYTVPVVVRARRRENGERFDARVAYYPRSFHAPASRLRRQLLSRLGLDDTTDAQVASIDLLFSHRFCGFLTMGPELSWTGDADLYWVQAGLNASGSFVLDYMAGYVYQPESPASPEQHRAYLRVSGDAARPLGVEALCRLHASGGDFWSISARGPGSARTATTSVRDPATRSARRGCSRTPTPPATRTPKRSCATAAGRARVEFPFDNNGMKGATVYAEAGFFL